MKHPCHFGRMRGGLFLLLGLYLCLWIKMMNLTLGLETLKRINWNFFKQYQMLLSDWCAFGQESENIVARRRNLFIGKMSSIQCCIRDCILRSILQFLSLLLRTFIDFVISYLLSESDFHYYNDTLAFVLCILPFDVYILRSYLHFLICLLLINLIYISNFQPTLPKNNMYSALL